MGKTAADQKSEVQWERIPPGDENALFNFYRNYLKEGGELFESLWRWRQNASPDFGPEIATVAWLEGDIIGSLGVMPLPLFLAGRQIRASWQIDSLVAPAARGKGVGRTLMEKAATDWDLVLAKGTSDAMYRLRKSAGYADVPLSNLLVRVLKGGNTEGPLLKRLGEQALHLWGSSVATLFRQGGMMTRELREFGVEFDVLANRLCSESVLRPRKVCAYLNWRYCQCPVKQYTVLASAASSVAAAIVLSRSGKDPGDAWVTDMICEWQDLRTSRSLIQDGIRHLEARSARRIWAFATLPAARRCLIMQGFVPLKATPRFTLRAGPGLSLPVPLVTDFWHGDGDVELYA